MCPSHLDVGREMLRLVPDREEEAVTTWTPYSCWECSRADNLRYLIPYTGIEFFSHQPNLVF